MVRPMLYCMFRLTVSRILTPCKAFNISKVVQWHAGAIWTPLMIFGEWPTEPVSFMLPALSVELHAWRPVQRGACAVTS